MIACPADVPCGLAEPPAEPDPTCAAVRLNRLNFWPQERVVLGAGDAFPQVAVAPVFIAEADRQRMAAAVKALHGLLTSPAWADTVCPTAPVVAQHDPGNTGVLYGFDFHLAPQGPKLIEINTNAGGALISVQLMKQQRRCCSAMSDPAVDAAAAERRILASFLSEWQATRPTEKPRTIAIVDADPDTQYLREEFRLFAALFRNAGIETVICDPHALEGGAGGLYHEGRLIDLVYNRLTDFYLEAPALTPLREAWLNDAVVLTPHPRAHALFADKRHLARLGDPLLLSALGLAPEAQAAILDVVLPTRVVRREDAEVLWRERRQLYFKPAGAFGGRGAYEGAKLTRSTFERLLEQDYVAQDFVPAPKRQVLVGAEAAELKFDVRCFVYGGEMELLAARLYRGQATNFRTPGGGFATVHVVPG
ncbi:MAG: hypothetical protein M0R77_08395 [Gammaproteobacteria bacterium]|jgi:hypothetical protein|nr:hypothetical protein [Gammaproteobacteria bacterium]